MRRYPEHCLCQPLATRHFSLADLFAYQSWFSSCTLANYKVRSANLAHTSVMLWSEAQSVRVQVSCKVTAERTQTWLTADLHTRQRSSPAMHSTKQGPLVSVVSVIGMPTWQRLVHSCGGTSDSLPVVRSMCG